MSENEPLGGQRRSAAELQRREMPPAPEPGTVAQQPVVFDFINIVSPADSRLSKHQRLVRSRAALKPRSVKQPRVKRKPKQAGSPVGSSSNTTTPGPESSSSKLVSKHLARVTQLSLQNRALGQGRVDPFRTYPVAWQPFMPALIDHHLTHLAPDIRDVDQLAQFGAMGMDQEYVRTLRDRWWPLSMTSPPLFLVEILFAASHSASIGKVLIGPAQLLQLKGQTIQAINSSLQARSESLTPATIGAVISMAGYEILFGDLLTNHVHMIGLQAMVAMRGGVDCLGLEGFVKKMLTWLDSLQQLLTGRTAYFPQLSSSQSMPDNGQSPSPTIPVNHLSMLTTKYLLSSEMADLMPRLKNLIKSLEAAPANKAARTGYLYLVEELSSIRSLLQIRSLQPEDLRAEPPDNHERVKFIFNECLRLGSLSVVEALLIAFSAADSFYDRGASRFTESLLQLDLEALTGIGIKHLVAWALLVSAPLKNDAVDYKRTELLATLFHELSISEWQQVEAILVEFPFSTYLKAECFQIFQRVAYFKPNTSANLISPTSSVSQQGGNYFTLNLGDSSRNTPAGSPNGRSSASSAVLTPLAAVGVYGSLPP